MSARDAENQERYEEVVEPKRQDPDPARVDGCLFRQVSREHRVELGSS